MKILAALALSVALLLTRTAHAQQATVIRDATVTGTVNISSNNENIPPSSAPLTTAFLLKAFNFSEVKVADTAFYVNYTITSGGIIASIELRNKAGTATYGTLIATNSASESTVQVSQTKVAVSDTTDIINQALSGSYYGTVKAGGTPKKPTVSYKFTFLGGGTLNSQTANIIGTFSGTAGQSQIQD